MTTTLQPQINENGQAAGGWNGETRQNQLYKPFLRGALVTVLTIGATLGATNLVAMGFKADLSAVWWPLIQAHAYGQIFGWVGLFIMGIALHMMPRFYLRPVSSPGLVFPAFALAAAGVAIRFVAQPFSALPLVGWLLPVSALLGLTGMSLFALIMFDTMRAGHDRIGSRATALYIGAGFGWLWLGSGATLALTLNMALTGSTTIPASLDAPYLRVLLSGAIVTTVLGFTLRIVPHMMNLDRPPVRAAVVALGGYTVGVLAQVGADAGLWGAANRQAAAVGSGLEALSLAAFVALLGIYRVGDRAVKPKKNPWPERFVLTAYFWALFAVAGNFALALYALGGTPAPHAFYAAYHHALTVGFISFMILGMSMRLVPAFIGALNERPQLAATVYGLVLVGNTARIFGQGLSEMFGGPFYIMLGASGVVEVIGLALFGRVLWQALDRPSYGQQTVRWQPMEFPSATTPLAKSER